MTPEFERQVEELLTLGVVEVGGLNERGEIVYELTEYGERYYREYQQRKADHLARVEAALERQVDRGLMEHVGLNEQGEPVYALTPLGRSYVEGLPDEHR